MRYHLKGAVLYCLMVAFNPLKTSPEYARAGVYGNYM